ncbi:long-chain acyl-CoA synthetase [Panacagrimonas perspica]|uniref:Long-chain acyl-CoA synthetase n=1 Tax=Panacagrimonas perspica TaxID=381431 RepID=A0A4R7NWL7_9GAMM|nr:AMP-binding protein [Panacagrimonas perspica]TDU25613.1 long-chain acyl-CoA synthetase [Panacagrimonas perspica]THD03792.1 acyl-CoA synthase [Panacagrimonas perspica]
MNSSVGELIRSAASAYRNKVALVFEDERWTFAELDRASSQLAGRLAHLGVVQGEVVSLYSPNCPEWIIGYYAVMKLGAVVNPLNLMLTPDEAAFAMSDCSAVAVIGSADKLDALLPVLAKTKLRHRISYRGKALNGTLDFDELLQGDTVQAAHALIQADSASTIAYTSGTTGHPKGAVLTHRGIMLNTAMTATLHLRTSSDVVVSALPCSHVYGNIVMNAAIAYGMTLVLHASFDAGRILESIQTHRATIFEGVPTMYMYLLEAPKLQTADLSSLRCCTVGGQTMPEAKMRQVIERFRCPLIELWGMTELGGLGTTHSAYGPQVLGSIGVALPHLEARVSDPEAPDQVVALGEVGELQIRGPMVMREYLNRPDATAQTLTPDGWLRTGDLARMERDGYLYVVDRLKDMIITAGFNIYPAELERVIAAHPDVALVAVGSIADDHKGELAKAYVVRRQGSTVDADTLEKHCRERLASYKVPRAWQFVSDVPKTSSGKIMRRMLHTIPAQV